MPDNGEGGTVLKSLSISRAKGTWTDRVITDAATQVTFTLMSLIQSILFYCECHTKLTGYSLSLHRDAKDGAVEAIGSSKCRIDTITVPENPEVIMKAKFWSSIASFRFGDREYHWKDRIRSSELRTDSGNIVARFQKRICSFRKDGELVIYVDETGLPVDIIIISFIMYLYRRIVAAAGGGHGGH